MEDGQPRHLEAYFSHRSGRRVPVKIRSLPVRDPDGKIIGSVEFFVESSPLSTALAELRSAREIADLDPLTGVGNRRMIQGRLASFGGKRQLGSRSAGVLFFDIDDFKNINDTFGHDAGDRVIIEVAHTATGMLRSFDTIGRWGGDEFVVIVPGVDLHDAALVAERLRAMVTAVRIPVDGQEIGVTISAGVTVIGTEETGEDALTRADHLMYTSKDQGRNRITAG
jgi:diguanylate cyclase (GGDEF)-like protein